MKHQPQNASATHAVPPVSAQRETRDFACEAKFLLSAAQAQGIREWARVYMQADVHGHGEFQDTYRISSVYFDTPEWHVYRRIGSYKRSKYRVRRYAQAATVFLERKTKTREQVSKRRVLVDMQSLAMLQSATVLAAPGWPGDWFARRLQLRQLQPVCQISYQRVARLANSETGPCRLTLDNELYATPVRQIAFSADSGQSLLTEGRYILELKYRYTLPVLFRRMLLEFAPVPRRMSKYRSAVEQLALATAAVPLEAV